MTTFQGCLDAQLRAGHAVVVQLAVGQDELNEILKIACWERKERLKMKKELGELKEDFTKLKGMVRLTVIAFNLQNNRVPLQDIADVFNSQIMESSSSKEEVPEENLVPVPVPVPGLLFEIPNTLWEIPLSPSLLLWAFLSEAIITTSSILKLGTSPHTGGKGL